MGKALDMDHVFLGHFHGHLVKGGPVPQLVIDQLRIRTIWQQRQDSARITQLVAYNQAVPVAPSTHMSHGRIEPGKRAHPGVRGIVQNIKQRMRMGQLRPCRGSFSKIERQLGHGFRQQPYTGIDRRHLQAGVLVNRYPAVVGAIHRQAAQTIPPGADQRSRRRCLDRLSPEQAG